MEIARLNQKNLEILDIWEHYYNTLDTLAINHGQRNYERFKEPIFEEVNRIYLQLKDEFDRMIGMDTSMLENLELIEPLLININDKSQPIRFLKQFDDLDFYFDNQWLNITELHGVFRFQQKQLLNKKVQNWISQIEMHLSTKTYDGIWATIMDKFKRLKLKWDFTSNDTDTPFTTTSYYLFDLGNIDFKSRVFEAIRSDIIKTFGNNYGILDYNCFLYGHSEEEGKYIYEIYNESNHQYFLVYHSGDFLTDYKLSTKEPKTMTYSERITKYTWYQSINQWVQENVYNVIEMEKPSPKANKYLLYTGDKLFTQGNFKQFSIEEKYIPESKIYFHLEKLSENKYKITNMMFKDSLIRLLKEAYPRNETRIKAIYPTEEDWAKAVSSSICVGGEIELDDSIPKFIKDCDHESGIYNRLYTETNWCLISFETIDILYKMFKDYNNEEKLTEKYPMDALELTGKVKEEFESTIKANYFWAKQDEIYSKALEFFLSNSNCSFQYDPKYEIEDK